MIRDLIDASSFAHRGYQERLVTKALNHFNDDVASVLLESACGSGKTAMGLLSATAMQNQHDCGVAWVTMRRDLLRQAKVARDESGLNPEIEFVSMFDKSIPRVDASGRPIKLLLVDECQHDACNSMAHVHNVIKPKWVLGLSATPYRTDRIKLVFQKVLKDAGIHQLIQDGYLSQYHQYTIDSYTPETVVETYLREPERWGKSVMYFRTREEAEITTTSLNQAGIRTELVDANSDRERQLAAFETGEIQVLTNMYVLTEGFNSPSLKTVFVRDSGRGPTIQMAGRVFRKYPNIEFKQVVQSKATKWPIHRTAHPAEAFVRMENSWRSHKASKDLEKVIIRTMRITARLNPQLPKFIEEANFKNRGLRRRHGGGGLGGALIH